MNFLQQEITELKQKIATNEERSLNETDLLQRQSLEKIIERDTVTLNNLYVQLAQIQSPPPCLRSLESHEMKCEIRIISGDFSITVPAVTDSGCQEDLVLEPQDIQDLQLNLLKSRRVGYADGSAGKAHVYGEVVIELTLTDGDVVQATVSPVLLEQTQTPDVAGVPTIPERLLGFPALDKLNLKLDFRNNMLTKRIRRI